MFSKAKDILSLDECESVIDRQIDREGVKEKRKNEKRKRETDTVERRENKRAIDGKERVREKERERERERETQK